MILWLSPGKIIVACNVPLKFMPEVFRSRGWNVEHQPVVGDDVNECGLDARLSVRPRNQVVSNGSVYEWFPPKRPMSESELAVDRALTKNSKYMEGVAVPFVLSVCGRDNVSWDMLEILQGLFGDMTICVSRNANRIVQLNHAGRGLNANRGTRISAIAFCNRRWSRSQLITEISVVHNPWARNPLHESVFAEYSQLMVIGRDPVRLAWLTPGEPFAPHFQ